MATSPNLPPDLKKPKPLPSDTASLNVNARLCNSNPVKEAFPTAIAAVKREFGIKDEVKVPAKKKRIRAKDYETTGRSRSMSISSADENYVPDPRVRRRRADDDSDDDGVLQNNSEGSDEEMEQYKGRLTFSDDEDSDNESGGVDIGDIERRLMAEGIPRKAGTGKEGRYDHAADLSLSEASEDESVEEEPRKAPAPKKSSFIPSLTMGGYISGSGSDVEDEVDVAPKKNRRGQRARQKIWEQKYGTRATHLQNEQRGQGWDPRRGAVDSDRGGRFGKNKGNGANSMALGKDRRGLGQSRGAATTEVKQRPKKDDSGPLHPSWEAAKRAKEKKAVPVAFTGKKISFD